MSLRVTPAPRRFIDLYAPRVPEDDARDDALRALQAAVRAHKAAPADQRGECLHAVHRASSAFHKASGDAGLARSRVR